MAEDDTHSPHLDGLHCRLQLTIHQAGHRRPPKPRLWLLLEARHRVQQQRRHCRQQAAGSVWMHCHRSRTHPQPTVHRSQPTARSPLETHPACSAYPAAAAAGPPGAAQRPPGPACHIYAVAPAPARRSTGCWLRLAWQRGGGALSYCLFQQSVSQFTSYSLHTSDQISSRTAGHTNEHGISAGKLADFILAASGSDKQVQLLRC